MWTASSGLRWVCFLGVQGLATALPPLLGATAAARRNSRRKNLRVEKFGDSPVSGGASHLKNENRLGSNSQTGQGAMLSPGCLSIGLLTLILIILVVMIITIIILAVTTATRQMLTVISLLRCLSIGFLMFRTFATSTIHVYRYIDIDIYIYIYIHTFEYYIYIYIYV